MHMFGGVVYAMAILYYLLFFKEKVNVDGIILAISSMVFSIVSCYNLIHYAKKSNGNLHSSSDRDQDGSRHINAIELVFPICNLCGSLLHTIGSILFLPSIYLPNAAVRNFLMGSIFFFLASLAKPQQKKH